MQNGDTPWSVLKRELDSRGISYRYTWSGKFNSVYVESIDGDGEFDHGAGSGWMYNVNGRFLDVGASQYELKENDKVQWRYTTNLGSDLGETSPTTNPQGEDKGGAIETPQVPTTPEKSEKIDLRNLYSDVGDIADWAISAVGEATEMRLVEGRGGAFYPKASMTRAEFTTILVGIIGLKADNGMEQKFSDFSDVTRSDWFYPHVNAAYQAGIIKGFPDGFHPNDKITREEMAVMVVRALSLQIKDQDTGLKDIPQVSAWAANEVRTVAALGMMSGWNNRFHPSGEVTREMATVVAMRAYYYMKGDSR
nr:S-layer homology domain-containing protein [Paenibacillus roseus]